MTTFYSIVHELPKSRWGASHLPNKQPADWPVMLKGLRSMWEIGEDTELLTVFVEWLDGSTDPLHRTL